MEEAWAELKQGVSLANRLNKTDDELVEFHTELEAALRSAVARRVSSSRTQASTRPLTVQCML